MSIESRHGVDDPGYEYVEPEAPQPDTKEWEHTMGPVEALVALLIPIAGLGLAIWRFGRGDIGPGFANLLLAVFSSAVVFVLLASGVINLGHSEECARNGLGVTFCGHELAQERRVAQEAEASQHKIEAEGAKLQEEGAKIRRQGEEVTREGQEAEGHASPEEGSG